MKTPRILSFALISTLLMSACSIEPILKNPDGASPHKENKDQVSDTSNEAESVDPTLLAEELDANRIIPTEEEADAWVGELQDLYLAYDFQKAEIKALREAIAEARFDAGVYTAELISGLGLFTLGAFDRLATFTADGSVRLPSDRVNTKADQVLAYFRAKAKARAIKNLEVRAATIGANAGYREALYSEGFKKWVRTQADELAEKYFAQYQQSLSRSISKMLPRAGNDARAVAYLQNVYKTKLDRAFVQAIDRGYQEALKDSLSHARKAGASRYYQQRIKGIGLSFANRPGVKSVGAAVMSMTALAGIAIAFDSALKIDLNTEERMQLSQKLEKAESELQKSADLLQRGIENLGYEPGDIFGSEISEDYDAKIQAILNHIQAEMDAA